MAPTGVQVRKRMHRSLDSGFPRCRKRAGPSLARDDINPNFSEFYVAFVIVVEEMEADLVRLDLHRTLIDEVKNDGGETTEEHANQHEPPNGRVAHDGEHDDNRDEEETDSGGGGHSSN